METVKVKTDFLEYPILIGTNVHETAMDHRLTGVIRGRDLMIVTDSNVAPLYSALFIDFFKQGGSRSVNLVEIPAGEPSKNNDMLQYIYHQALGHNLGRDAIFAALGGGVVGDLAGFAAATFMRGVDYIQIPTSLLAMVDSSVGGKVGIDLAEGKNLVGAFHHPRLVITPINSLDTLPVRELRCGLAEIIKYGFIMEPDLLKLLGDRSDRLLHCDLPLYTQIVQRCCELKAQIVAEDERENTGRRALLNYGHTFGHAIEALTGYESLNHGEAVAIGMVIAAELARDLGMTSDAFVDLTVELLEKFGLPTSVRAFHLDAEDILRSIMHDKKVKGGKPRFVLPCGWGQVKLTTHPTQDQVLNAIRRRCE